MDSPTASSRSVDHLSVEDQQNQCEHALGAWSAAGHGWTPLEHHQEKQFINLRATVREKPRSKWNSFLVMKQE